MLGATLRVKSRLADSCRANGSVSILVLDSNDWFIEAMFIDPLLYGSRPPSGGPALRQEGHVYRPMFIDALRYGSRRDVRRRHFAG